MHTRLCSFLLLVEVAHEPDEAGGVDEENEDDVLVRILAIIIVDILQFYILDISA